MSETIQQGIRQLVIDDIETVRSLVLSPPAVLMVKYIGSNKKGVLSQDIAEKFSITIQNASNKLNNLHKLGYLVRRELTSESGGIQFRYWVSPDINV